VGGKREKERDRVRAKSRKAERRGGRDGGWRHQHHPINGEFLNKKSRN